MEITGDGVTTKNPEEDVPHYSKREFQKKLKLNRESRISLGLVSCLVCQPWLYFIFVEAFRIRYRGLPPNCQPFQPARSNEYIRRMQGSYSVANLEQKEAPGYPCYSDERVDVSGNQMIFSGGTKFVRNHGYVPTTPSDMYLHFFEGKQKNRIFCDYYGSMINLEESDFDNQIIFDICFGFRLRFTRIIDQQSPEAVVPVSLIMSASPVRIGEEEKEEEEEETSNLPILCSKCATPKPFAESQFCGKCGESYSS